MKTYLGDGLYADFDGWQIELSAERFDEHTGLTTHRVYLEPGVYAKLLRYHEALMDARARNLALAFEDDAPPPPPEAE